MILAALVAGFVLFTAAALAITATGWLGAALAAAVLVFGLLGGVAFTIVAPRGGPA